MDRIAPLRTLLSEYSPLDAGEAVFRRRMLELCGVEGDPLSRRHFVPGHFTASAFVLSPASDRLLLIQHRKLKRWLQPGGHVDPGDVDVLASARREVAEEVGLADVPLHPAAPRLFDVDVHVIPAFAAEPEHEHFDLRFLFVARDERFAAGEEVAGARWVPLDQVATAGSDRSVERAVEKVRLLLGGVE